MRAIIGIVVGIVLGFAAQTALDLLANLLYPPPLRDMLDREQIAGALAARPTAAHLISVAGYFVGGLAGGWSGKKVTGSRAIAWVPAALLALMALAIGFSFPVPTWVTFAAFVGALVGGMIANHLVADRLAESAAETGASEA